MRAAIYARVSIGEKQDPEMQLRELEEFAGARQWNSETFVDRVSSGERIRPELERMLALCRRRRIDVVLVYRFDRFARSSLELIRALDEFNVLGIQFISLHESIDTTTPMGKFAFAVFAAMAEFERALIRQRVRSGVANARAKGKVLGRPRRQVDVSEVRRLRSAGRSWRQLARQFGISTGTARRIVYEGALAGLKEFVKYKN
jgi:DNA invertase Pin-like site-specific DNA recombinase